jgi:hypothetical protein
MKTQSCILRKLTIGLFLLLTVGMLHAQSQGNILRIRIPFNFNVGEQRFLAGEYTLQPLRQHTMLLQDRSGEVVTNFFTNSVESKEAPDSAKLVFHSYEGRHFLAEMWQPGSDIGQELLKSTTEREMEKYLPVEPVTLAFATHR